MLALQQLADEKGIQIEAVVNALRTAITKKKDEKKKTTKKK
jgi:hypothetical protein